MFVDFLLEGFHEHRDREAIIWRDRAYHYKWLLEAVRQWQDVIRAENLPRGAVTVVEGEFSPQSVSLILALMEHGCIIVPLTSSVAAQKAEFIDIAQCEAEFTIRSDDTWTFTPLPHSADHEFYRRLRELGHPGLILFSSGSTGKSKAAVHDLARLLEKFHDRRRSYRTILFLLYDHIGGINTLLHILANGGCGITLEDRSPDRVLSAIEKFQVELLPTSPTFINLILLSEAYQRYDLGSLKLVTYGTEPMPESTLKRFHELFPQVKLLQTNGLSEVGILGSQSKSSDSLWVKLGGEGYETRVVEGILQIKARSAMLGYLNAPSPFTADGWFNTGDSVEVDGEYFRILGRVSEIINVGGEKVYPIEMESTIQEMDNVAEVTVYGEPNPILGNIVCAKITLAHPEYPKAFSAHLKKFCRDRLPGYKVPIKVLVDQEKQHSGRFKKKRFMGPLNPVPKLKM